MSSNSMATKIKAAYYIIIAVIQGVEKVIT